MLKMLYSVRDHKSKHHKDLFAAMNHDDACRLLHSAAFAPNGPTMFAQYPDDFSLYYHGVYNVVDGSTTSDNFDIEEQTPSLRPIHLFTMRQILERFNEEQKKRPEFDPISGARLKGEKGSDK